VAGEGVVVTKTTMSLRLLYYYFEASYRATVVVAVCHQTEAVSFEVVVVVVGYLSSSLKV